MASAGDFAVPIPTGGSLIIQHPQFIVINSKYQQFNVKVYDPMLTFGVVDKSSAPWKELKVQFDMGGICNGEIRQWSESVTISSSTLAFMDEIGMKNYDHSINSLTGKVQGCSTEIIKVRVGDPPAETLNLKPELEAIKLKRDSERAAETAAKGERDRVAAEERAKRDVEHEKQEAADAARRKRLADEQKKKMPNRMQS